MNPEEDHGPRGLSRRTMLGVLLGGTSVGLLSRFMPAAFALPLLRIERIGLQLYTVRKLLAGDVEGTIAAVAAAGVKEVEFAGYYNHDPAWWRALLDEHGLTAPATHEGMPADDSGWEAIMSRAAAMGHEYVIVPSVYGGFKPSRDSWKNFAARLNTGAVYAKEHGLSFGYHNHDHEFAAVEGTTGFEILAAETDPDTVKLELDIYWAVKGGQDPLAIMKRWPGRVTCCHVKDAGPAPEHKMMDVGAGTIDFRSLLAEGRKLGLQHWFIEHDNPVDPLASVRASAAAMRAL